MKASRRALADQPRPGEACAREHVHAPGQSTDLTIHNADEYAKDESECERSGEERGVKGE